MADALQMAKAEIRMKMVDRRARMRPDARATASERIVARIADEAVFQRASSFCCFSPLREEVQVMPLVELAARNGARIFLPAYDEVARHYRFREWDRTVPLRAGRWNILEPQGTTYAIPEGDVCIIVPGQAFDRTGMRIGYGGGYFDRMLRETRIGSNRRVSAIGVAYHFQVLDWVPHDQQDEPIDFLATEIEWIKTHR